MGRTDKRIGINVAIALLIAGAMSAIWAWRDWANLSVLRLPDTDDMMRLQQVRDWLGGQAFADLSQHRLGMPPGLAMHWSRLADLGPAALILLIRPLLGEAGAEQAAVILWPALLFAAAIFLAGRTAQALAGREAGPVAMLLGAVAYPMTAVFLPGRIDHHALQIVLVLTMTLWLVRPATLGAGAAAGAAAAISLAIGLETAPIVAVALGACVVAWIAQTERAGDRLVGFGIALGGVTLVASIVLRTRIWPNDVCDSFAPSAIAGLLIAATATVTLGLTTRFLASITARATAAAVAAVIAGLLVWRLAPACIADPYHAVDPLVARLWLASVEEARPLFALPAAVAIGYGGMMIAGIAATAARLRFGDRGGWAMLVALQGMALAVTLVEARGAHIGAALALPALASWIVETRRRAATLPLAAAWLGSAGIAYGMIGAMVAPAEATKSPPVAAGDCTRPAALAALRRLPPGRLMAPIDLGAYALAATDLSIIAAPYHRDNAGNAAMYRFFLGSPVAARSIARQWRVRYVAYCSGSLAIAPPRDSVAADLDAGHAPKWLAARPSGVAGLSLYDVKVR